MCKIQNGKAVCRVLKIFLQDNFIYFYDFSKLSVVLRSSWICFHEFSLKRCILPTKKGSIVMVEIIPVAMVEMIPVAY